MQYYFYPEAQADLANIWQYGYESYGLQQSDQYITKIKSFIELLAKNPALFPVRSEFTGNIRIAPTMQHLIIYHIVNHHICVVRILHRRSYVENHL